MKYKIAVFPGDGVGPELVKEGMKVVDKAAELDKFNIEWVKYPFGAEHYFETKELLTEKILGEIRDSCIAIYCGTFNNSEMKALPEKSISGMIKNYFDQFAGLRPVKLFPNVESPLANKAAGEIDLVIVRENSEDFYVGASGRAKNGKNKNQIEVNKGVLNTKFGLSIETKGSEIAYQIGILSRKGCERLANYAFEYAKRKNKKNIVFVDKANMLDSYNFWRESIDKIAREFPNLEYKFDLIDAAVINLIRQPEKYEMLIAPNLFGDILSDLGTAIQGGLAFAVQGNINPEGISMFEPIHGSATKLKNQGIVNPIATIWAGALMLENIGQQKSGDLVTEAIGRVLKNGKTMTQDLGGNNTTSEMGDAIVDKLIEIHD
ncbi:MAG: isocitrate/isopropylmalate family dehydrogenase [Nanoarchaeota archaeon]